MGQAAARFVIAVLTVIGVMATIINGTGEAQAIKPGGSATGAPWLAQMTAGNSMCSGALISPTRVITAKHCVRTSRTGQVKLGERAQRTVRFTGAVVHPDLDVAILKLAEPVLDLTPVTVSPTTVRIGTVVQERGWGMNRFPARQATSRVVLYSPGSVPARVYTKDDARKSSRTEKGDSGGPLTAGGVLVGVLSGTMWSSATGNYDMYTNTGAMAGWVSANLL